MIRCYQILHSIFLYKYIKINKTACMINFNIIFLPKILMDTKFMYFVLIA